MSDTTPNDIPGVQILGNGRPVPEHISDLREACNRAWMRGGEVKCICGECGANTLAARSAAADKARDDAGTDRLLADVQRSRIADKPITPAEKDRINAYVESQRALIEAMGRLVARTA
jgi:hypothetical protein